MSVDVADLEQKIKSLQGEINSKIFTLRGMQERLEKYFSLLDLPNHLNKKRKIKVSDHAVLRTIERLYHIDIDEIKDQLLPDEVVKRINFIGKGKGSATYGGIIYVVDNYTIITVYPENDED